MLGVMFQKLVSKKWMFLCLFLGCVLLIATVISFPLYENAVFDGMLHDQFEKNLQETGVWPTKISMVTVSGQETQGENMFNMEMVMDNLGEQLGVVTKENTKFYRLPAMTVDTVVARNDFWAQQVRMAYMSELPKHVELLAGEMYSEDGYSDNGAIEVVVTKECMAECNLLVGEELVFEKLKDASGERIRIQIVGVVAPVAGDYYWEIGTDELYDVCLMEENLFRQTFIENGRVNERAIVCHYSYLFEYNSLEAKNVDVLLANLAESNFIVTAFEDVLENFETERGRITATLFILQVPVLVLLGAFLFMISGQMYEIEQHEISVIKSRGSSGGQIFRLYIYQSVFLALLGAAFGIPLGAFFCKILGSARNFLEFSLRRDMVIDFDETVWIYLIVAAVCTVLIMAIPAVKHSRLSIVNLKQKQVIKSRPLWDKLFLDVICLGISMYGYYSFSKSEKLVMQSVLSEKSLDPLLYISSSLFIVGAGLLYLRLQPLFIKLVYSIGQRFWRPATYASFLEIIKNGKKQQFIMLFLILTIALGTYHATVARTILQNARANEEYLGGADIIVKEVWNDNYRMILEPEEGEEPVTFRYYVPDYDKYSQISGVKSYTRVMDLNPDDLDATGGYATAYNPIEELNFSVRLMGIHTKEFGENTWLKGKWLDDAYYNYLNKLAEEPNGVLVSRAFQTQFGYEVGDNIGYTYGITDKMDISFKCLGKIVGIVDYWPSFVPTTSYMSEDGQLVTADNYLIVANMGQLLSVCSKHGEQPYEVWITLEEGADPDRVVDWIDENGLKIEKYADRVTAVEKTVTDPLLQGTNGVLTMGFLVMIILCAVGYLVYWIMSIRSREMMFGVLRAFGMHKAELFHMLMMEQVFSGILTGFAGIAIGKMVSSMYTPMLQTAYAAVDQVLPMELYTNPADMVRLYSALLLVLAVCLIVLIVIVFKLNVAKALKLGEE